MNIRNFKTCIRVADPIKTKHSLFVESLTVVTRENLNLAEESSLWNRTMPDYLYKGI